ncbi:MAG: response regulator [Nitrospirales bacterium]
MAKILVIDDDRGIRDLLNAVLSHRGYHVLLAESGQKGLELYRQERPDVIVLDLKMPEMDGLTVLRHVRSLNIHQSIIMYSGAYTPKSEDQILALGITEMVTKDGSLERGKRL